MSRSHLTTICNWNPAGPGRLPSPAAGPGRRRSGRSAARPRARPAPPRPGGPARAPSLGHPRGPPRLLVGAGANSATGRREFSSRKNGWPCCRPPTAARFCALSMFFRQQNGKNSANSHKSTKALRVPATPFRLPCSDCPVPRKQPTVITPIQARSDRKRQRGTRLSDGIPDPATGTGIRPAPGQRPEPDPATGHHPANGQNQTRPQATAATRPTARNHNQRVRHAGGSGGSPPGPAPRTIGKVVADHRTARAVASRGRGGI